MEFAGHGVEIPLTQYFPTLQVVQVTVIADGSESKTYPGLQKHLEAPAIEVAEDGHAVLTPPPSQ